MEPGPGGGAEHMENKVYATLWPVLIHSRDLLRGESPQPRKDTPSLKDNLNRILLPHESTIIA